LLLDKHRSQAVADADPRPAVAHWAGLACLVLLAVGLRLIPIVFVPSIPWPDEIFQISE
jgi:hypothetical protein